MKKFFFLYIVSLCGCSFYKETKYTKIDPVPAPKKEKEYDVSGTVASTFTNIELGNCTFLNNSEPKSKIKID